MHRLQAAKQFFGERRVHYDFVDIDGDADGLRIVEEANSGKHIIPVLKFKDGSTLIEPSNAELAEKVGLQTVAKSKFYDLIAVGSGPAGLTAAFYYTSPPERDITWVLGMSGHRTS